MLLETSIATNKSIPVESVHERSHFGRAKAIESKKRLVQKSEFYEVLMGIVRNESGSNLIEVISSILFFSFFAKRKEYQYSIVPMYKKIILGLKNS